jgi:hypothetical protein
MNKITLKTGCGDTYSEVAEKAKQIARETLTTEFEFNGVTNLVTKNTNLDWLWRDYCNAWLMGWTTVGPDCVENYSDEVQKEYDTKKAAQEAKDEQRRLEIEAQDKAEKEAFEAKVTGVEFEVIPEKADEYKTYAANNSKDGYSKAVIEYGENWAKLMQVELAAGKSIIDIADETQKGLGYLGITGFQYGCAVKGLSHFWKHGEALRKWHNKEYGHEGEGVVNPAVLTLKSQ